MDEFLKAYAGIEWPGPIVIEYRIYYDVETGRVIDYTNEQRPGTFIKVDRETFARHRFDCVVKDGKLVFPREPLGKLVPAGKGTVCHVRDITIIVDESQPHQRWTMKTYED